MGGHQYQYTSSTRTININTLHANILVFALRLLTVLRQHLPKYIEQLREKLYDWRRERWKKS